MANRTPEEILKYCECATEGPWAWIQYAEKENSFAIGIAINKDDNPVEGFTETEEYNEDSDMFIDTIMWKKEIGCSEAAVLNYDDPKFICFARTDLPMLAREVIRLRAENQRLRTTQCDCGIDDNRHLMDISKGGRSSQ